jgi:hypothetical protein
MSEISEVVRFTSYVIRLKFAFGYDVGHRTLSEVLWQA